MNQALLALVNSARARLRLVRAGDGYNGWPEAVPFDPIMRTSAPPQVPQALIDQLKPGGKLVSRAGRESLGFLGRCAISRTSVLG